MRDAKILVIGVGGLGSVVAQVLVQSGARHLTLMDDDVVEMSNLHRQLLYREEDTGRAKTEAAADRLQDLTHDTLNLHVIADRFTPENAIELAASHDLVIEGADNMATKFLAADACALTHTPCVQAGIIRWQGWAFAQIAGPSHPCLRCVFEDMPQDRVETCATAGVVGPAVGVVAALQARLCLQLVAKRETPHSPLWSYDGLAGRIRRLAPRPRPDCPLCSGEISEIYLERYLPPDCAAS